MPVVVNVVAGVIMRGIGRGSEVAERSFCDPVRVGQRCLWCVIFTIVQWVVCVTTSMVQDAWWLYPCVRDEIRTYICESGCGVAAVAIEVDRETADASRGLKRPEKE